MSATLLVFTVLVLFFDLLNGMQDSSNMTATVITTRALAPLPTRILIAFAEFMGPFLFGTAVAHTIGSEIANPAELQLDSLFAALGSAILWNIFAWKTGLPTSSSHAIIGGLIGAVVFHNGWGAIHADGILKVIASLLLSPLVSFIAGYLLTRFVYWAAQNARPSINQFFRQGQIVTSIALAFSHGGNDAQKTMGLVTMALIITGLQTDFVVPTWVKLACAFAIASGTAIGNKRLTRKIGQKFYKVRPINGFDAQVASTAVILTASLLGGPVSTSQVVSSAILGAGASERWGKVRWHIGGEILIAWLVTIPANILVAMGLSWLLHFLPVF